MQKVLGSDRLLFVEVPCLDNPPRGDKGQEAERLRNAYRSFAVTHGLALLGRIYRPMCFKARKMASHFNLYACPSISRTIHSAVQPLCALEGGGVMLTSQQTPANKTPPHATGRHEERRVP